MIRVLHVCKTFKEDEGGVEHFVDSLCFSLQKKREVLPAVLTTTSKGSPYTASVYGQPAYYFPRNFTIASSPFSFSFLKNFRRISEGFDIIHYHFPWPFADLTALVAGVRKPSIITYHSDIVRQRFFKLMYSPLMHLFFNRSDAIVTTSANLLNSSPVLKRYGHKTAVIPIGLDKGQYPEPAAATVDFWRRKLHAMGLREGEAFLFVGTLRYYKGLEFLLQAIQNTDLAVLIVGAGADGEKLKKMVDEKGITNAHFLGHLNDEDKTSLIKLCRAVVSPAHLRSEAFCISLLEGLMFSKPLISTELQTGTSFVNQHGMTGLVVPPRDPAALRDAMQRLATDPALYEEFSKNTRLHYERHFRGDAVAEAYTAIYKSISGK